MNSLEVILFSISTPPGEGVRSGDYREEEEGRRERRRREREKRREDGAGGGKEGKR